MSKSLEIVSVEYAEDRKIGNGLPVGGAYVETWTRSGFVGVENRDSRQAMREIEYMTNSDAYEVTKTEGAGHVCYSCLMPGALDLTHVYYLPV
jgi:hypothetical protein